MKLISGQIYQYLQSVQAYISPPIAAVFLARHSVGSESTRRGALAALLTGFVLGLARLMLELNTRGVSGTGCSLVRGHQLPALRGCCCS